MPRAITFTGALYSVGVPPEFLGTGRILNKLDDKELSTLMKYYPNIKHDYAHVAKYFSKDAFWLPFKLRTLLGKQLTKISKPLNAYLISRLVHKRLNKKKHAQLAADLVKISDKETKTTLISRQAIYENS